MSDSLCKFEPVEQLAEEFLARYRRGERPSLSEYISRYPDLAAQIQEYFPAMVVMEELGSVGGKSSGTLPRTETEGGRIPQQLGEYRILREVGRGGMGIVYEAAQESLGRHVALKVLPFHGLLNPTHRERFRREARAAARLHHTNIVPVFAVGEHGGLHYYAMQFIHGQGLHEVLHEVKRLRAPKQAAPQAALTLAASVAESLVLGQFPSHAPQLAADANPGAEPTSSNGPSAAQKDSSGPPSTSHSELTSQPDAQYFRGVAQIGVQVAEALQYAHDEGVLHRDIKPSNLLLDTAGRAWVTDFGLAKADETDELTDPGDIVGTLCYMAPERFRGEANARTDVYGLGITLYELLALRPAFAQAPRAQLIERVTQEEPRRPRKIDPRVPRDLETIVLKAMAKDSSDRYPKAQALADDLRQFLADRPIQARRTLWLERVWRWCRRNKALVWTGTAFCLLALAMLAGSLGWIARDRAMREAAVDLEVDRALDQAVELLKQTQWPQAAGALDRAARLLRAAGRTQHPWQLQELQRDVAMASHLEDIYSERSSREFSFGAALDRRYATAFADYDLDLANLSREEAAERLGHRTIRLELGRALDSWSGLRRRAKIQARPDWQALLEIAKTADPEPWRCHLRDALLRNDRKAVEELAASPDLRRLPPETLGQLGLTLLEFSPELDRQAIVAMQKAQRQYPGDLWINYSLARLYASQNQYDQYLRFLTAVLALRPGNAYIVLLIGEAWDVRGSPSEALDQFSRALELKPNYPEARLRRADLYQRLGQREKALADYDRAIELAPTAPELWYHRGLVYYVDKQWAQAVRDFSRYIELAPENLRRRGWQERAYAYRRLGQWAEAVADYSRLIEVAPSSLKWWHDRAIAYAGLGQNERALADLSRCLELDDKSAQVCADRGDTRINLRQVDLAIADYSKALALDPKLAQAWRGRGSAYLGLRQWPKAIDDLSKAIELDGQVAQDWAHRGLAYMSLRQWDMAITNYSKVIKLAPSWQEAWTQRGFAYLSLQQWDKAIADYSKAVELNPRAAQSWSYRGYAYARRERWQKALADYSKAVELNPTFWGTWLDRGHIYTLVEQWDRADADFRKGLALNPQATDKVNEIAWFWATCPEAKYRDAAGAVDLAKRAVKRTPNEGGYWNTLGVAHYRVRDWKAAIEALNKSMELRRGGDAFDWFFLAMTHWQLGEKQTAREWYDRAVKWTEASQPANQELRRFWAEAEKLLAAAKQPPSDSKKENLTPELAKAALLKMMRSKEGQDLGWFKGRIPDNMAKMKIAEEKDGWHSWTGAFRFHPSKAIYTFVVKPTLGVRACVFEYEGSFVWKDRAWSATPPKLARTALQPGD
jgi:tetratricopeptide (TPR) repeat protein/serine/threonine protein kinase